MNEFVKKLQEAVTKNKKLSALLVLGIVVLFLIMFSQKKEAVSTAAAPEVSDSKYCAELEEKIKSIVTAITLDKDCIVAVTLETGSEYVYAYQNKTDTDLSREGENGAAKESETREQEYIIVKAKDGSEEALVITEKKPTIRGVAIVSGGITKEKEAGILNAVSSVLGISSRKISITNKS
jgi:stage III sporulation protein AG